MGALVTGAASGIGKAVAEELGRHSPKSLCMGAMLPGVKRSPTPSPRTRRQ
jgi:hypothetical protein